MSGKSSGSGFVLFMILFLIAACIAAVLPFVQTAVLSAAGG